MPLLETEARSFLGQKETSFPLIFKGRIPCPSSFLVPSQLESGFLQNQSQKMFFFKLSVRSFAKHPGNSQHLPVFTLAVDKSRQLEHQEPSL